MSRRPQNRIALPAALLALVAAACGDGVSIRAATGALGACDLTGVEARLTLPEQSRVCKLTLDAKKTAYTGTCADVQPGAGVGVNLEYLKRINGKELILARAQRKVTIDSSQSETTITFKESDYNYSFDEDSDLIPNLDEHCLGTDPLKPTTFTGTIAAEPGAVGASRKVHVIGERIKILGENLPPANKIKVTFGPLLGDSTGKVTVQPVRATAGEIEVQIPPGLDVSGPVSIEVDALGKKLTRQLTVARVLTVVTGLVGGTLSFRLGRGNWVGKESDKAKDVCIDPNQSDTKCAEICGGWLHHVSADGRYLLAICIYNQKSGTQPVQVFEVPTGTRWKGILPNIAAAGTPRFVLGDTYIALADQGRVAFHPFDATNRKVGPEAGAITVPGVQAMAVGGKARSELALFSRAGGKEQAHRYALSEDSGGKPIATANGTIDLKVACPGSTSDCGAEWSDGMAVLDPGRVVLSRWDLNTVDFINFNTPGVTSRPHQRPRAVAIPPRTRKRVFVSSLDTDAGGKGLGVCRFATFGAAIPTCSYLYGTVYSTMLLVHMVIPPEEADALVTFRNLSILTSWFKYFDLNTMLFVKAVAGINPLSMAVQP